MGRREMNGKDTTVSKILEIAGSYLDKAEELIYSYGSRTFLSGYSIYDTEHDNKGNIDCATLVLLVLAGIPYEESPYAFGTVRGLTPRPLVDMDLSRYFQLPDRYINIAERIGRPYLACPEGLDLEKAELLGISIETLMQEIKETGIGRRSEMLAGQLMEQGACFTDPSLVWPGDLVFYRSARFLSKDRRNRDMPPVTHVGIISADTTKMINSSGYLNKERALAEGLPAVSLVPVEGKREPAFFARPPYI